MIGAAAEEIHLARQRLLEEALMLERLSEDHAKRPSMARVGHLFDPRAPARDEFARVTRIGLANRASGLGAAS